MKFFIPGATDQSADRVLEDIRAHAAATTSFVPNRRRIWRIEIREGGEIRTIEVGDIEPQNSERVVAILDAVAVYFVCTASGDTGFSMPIQIHAEDVLDARSFD
jgi:hypothetical protein